MKYYKYYYDIEFEFNIFNINFFEFIIIILS